MKRILFAFAFALVAAVSPRAEARDGVSIDFFYNNLVDDGSWVEVADYGYCWQPNVALRDSSWRPYSDGYWAYTDVGWTWVSYEPFGWATYHYGRWARLSDYGWVWVPGTEWGPAWVSWRTGGDYVGWAPLPPRRIGYGEPIYEGRPIYGRVDLEFNIGPLYYNFCDVRYIGEPVLRRHIYAPTQNITYINQTVNVTNITYTNNVVYNHGPDYNYLSAYSTRPIQRLRLRRDTNVDLVESARSGALTKVSGDQLLVATPLKVEKQAQQVAPKVVKTKLEQPKLETGWSGITDPNAKAQIEEKMKTEDAKTIPAPRVRPVKPELLERASVKLGASPAGGAAPAPATEPAATTAATAAPEGAPAVAEKEKKGDRNRAAPTPQTGSEAAPQATAAPVVSEKEKQKDMRKAGGLAAPPATGSKTENVMSAPPTGDASAESAATASQNAGKKAEREQMKQQAQEAAEARRVQMQQEREAQKAARTQQLQQEADNKRAAREQQMQQMKQAQDAANERKAQMQQASEAARANQMQQMQEQNEAKRAAREQMQGNKRQMQQQAAQQQQQQQAVQQQPQQGNQAAAPKGGGEKPKKGKKGEGEQGQGQPE